MAWRDLDIGAVSAYAIAVEHGYTGTEEEWANEQAAAGTNAHIAKKSAETAVAAAKAAQSNLDSIKSNTEQAIIDIQTEGSTQKSSVTSTGDAQNQRVMDTGAKQSRALSAQGDVEQKKVIAAGDEQVSRVTNVGNGAVESVTLEKTNAINDVQNAKTEAVNSVETAGTTAVKAVKSAESAAIQNIGTGVDDTLSISGKAADAKKTGDSISSLQKDVVAITPDDTAIDGKPWSSKKTVDMLCPPLEEIGNPVVCYPVAGYPLGVKVSWTPTQEGSGDPSPENIRPIKGRTEVKVERCGENLLNIKPFGTRIQKGVTFEYVPEGGIHIQGTASASADSPTFPVWHLPPGKYYGLDMGAGIAASIVVLRNGRNLWLNTKGIFEILAGDVTIYCYLIVTSGATFDITLYPYIVPGNNAPKTYTPYIGSTSTLALSSTVYGGEVDAEGKGQETWGCIDSYAGETLPAEWICDRAAYAAGTTPPNGAQVAYKLDKPKPFTATGGTVIPALSGTNTVLTDADSVTVTGRADPIQTIAKLSNRIAALEAAATNITE